VVNYPSPLLPLTTEKNKKTKTLECNEKLKQNSKFLEASQAANTAGKYRISPI